MPDLLPPSFEHAATLEELAGLGKNRRFDDVIDDEESEEIQVICKRGDEEIPLAKPSRAFYFGDRTLYDQEARRFDQNEKAQRQICRRAENHPTVMPCVNSSFELPGNRWNRL